MMDLLDLLRLQAPFSTRRGQRTAQTGGTPAQSVEQLRAPLGDADRVLLTQTHLWLRRIPGRLQPKQLCRFYPRVANRLAACWSNPVEFEAMLRDLLVDRRGGRAGFSPRIVVELQILGRFRKRLVESSWRDRLHDQAGRA